MIFSTARSLRIVTEAMALESHLKMCSWGKQGHSPCGKTVGPAMFSYCNQILLQLIILPSICVSPCYTHLMGILQRLEQ